MLAIISFQIHQEKEKPIVPNMTKLTLIYFSAEQIHLFVTPYSWDINLLISQAIKMQWLILLLTTLPETNTAGMQYANTTSWAAFSCTFCHTPHNHRRTQMEWTGTPITTENFLKLSFEHTVFQEIKTTFSGH